MINPNTPQRIHDEWQARYDALAAEARRLKLLIIGLHQAALPDPNDEREVSVDWLCKKIHEAYASTVGAKHE